MTAYREISGRKGGKGGGGGSVRTPREEPNTLRSTSKARIIDLISEGPVVGLADGLRSVFIDGTPLQASDGSSNFQGVTVHTRQGEPDQSHIPGFPAVETGHDVSTRITQPSPVVRTVSNSSVDAVLVTIQLPALSYQEPDTGDLKGTSVEIAIDVRSGAGDWIERRRDTVQGKTTSPYQRSYRVALDGSGPWDVRVRRITTDSEEANRANETWWASYTEIIDAKLTYPDSALVALEVDAQQFGSQIPARAYDYIGRIVQVPTNYDPETRAYSGMWDGSWRLAWTDNPAWIFHDLASHPRYGVDIEHVDKWALYAIAQYCDELVPNGYGEDEPRFTFNTQITDDEDAARALSTIAAAFRGMTYWGTDSMMAVADMPSDPVKLVGPGNVIGGDFERQGSGLKARHSVAMVTWNDPDDDYRQQIEVVEDPDAIQRFGWRQTDVVAAGCTSRGQAHRLGRWILYSERAETETISYQASVDHADVMPGDIIAVSDPSRAGARLTGRLLASGTTQLHLDARPDEVSGSNWYLDVVLPSGGIERRQVQSWNGNQVSLAQPLSDTPVLGAMWVLSSASIQPELFRVLVNEESDNHTFTITAIEHDPDKYARVEHGLALPERPTSLIPTGPVAAPMSITVEPYTYLAGGTEHQGITISWTPSRDARVISYVAEVQGPDDVSWGTTYTGIGTSFDVRDAMSGEWQIRVRGVTGTGSTSSWVVLVTNVAGLLVPVPPDSVDLQIATFSISLIPRNIRPQLYEFRRANAPLNEGQIESNAVFLGISNTLVDTGLRSATLYYYWIRGVNAYGVSSWYPVQATTGEDFEDIIGAIDEEIRRPGGLYDNLVNDTQTAAEDAVDQALEGVYESISELRAEYEDVDLGFVELERAQRESSLLEAIRHSAAIAKTAAASAYIRTEEVVRVDETSALSTRIVSLNADYQDNKAEVRQQLIAYADELGSVAQSMTRVETNVASVQQDLIAVYDDETGAVARAVTVATIGNRTAVLGIQVDGTVAEIGAIADRFYILNPVGGEYVLAFVVENGQVVVPDARIGRITFTKLRAADGSLVFQNGRLQAQYIDADSLVVRQAQSNNFQAGSSGFRFQQNGNAEMNQGIFRATLQGANGTFSGTLTAGAINAVRSVNIAGRSATTLVGNYRQFRINFGGNGAGTWEVIREINYDSLGGNVLLVASAGLIATLGGNDRGWMRICRNGDPVIEVRVGVVISSNLDDPPSRQESLSIIDSPAQGDHLYTLEARIDGSSGLVSQKRAQDISLSILESTR